MIRRFLGASCIGALLLVCGGTGAGAARSTFEATGVNSATGVILHATVVFEASGGDLVVTLGDVGGDVLAPSDVLTAVFFDLAGNPDLTGASAILASGSTIFFGVSDPGGVVGGEWAYGSHLSGAPAGATYGISSSGFGLFGNATFPGNNLQGPAAVDGVQYGITSAADDPGTGNRAVTGANALIHSSVVFTLRGLPADFDPSSSISNVAFQYGTALSDPSLPTSGACCLIDGSCVIDAAAGCETHGGTYHGDGTVCDPNPCPQPPMACCFPDGHCEFVTEEACIQLGGRPQGYGTVCDPNPCPQPPMACCFPDGHCEFVTEEACIQLGGQPQGYGTVCDPNPCLQPPMACCFPDGRCEFVTEEACIQLGGQPQGYGTVCDPNPCLQPPMACCFPDGHCEFVTEEACIQLGGQPQGYGTACDPNPCPQPPLACCFPDGHCEYVTETVCLATGGDPQGYGTICQPNLCPLPPETGACCIGDHGHCEVLTADQCAAQGGAYQGDNVPCDPNPCPIVPVRNTTWGQIKANYR